MSAETLFDKVWGSHVVATDENGRSLLYVDLHLIHEVTSPQAFEGLRLAGRTVRNPHLTLATIDHNVPTVNRLDIRDALSKRQIELLRSNTAEFGIELYDVTDPRQGIVHIIGPEQGLTNPGMTIVCGDSHTSTHGAFGALAFGIGTSQVEHVLATQTIAMTKPDSMSVNMSGQLGPGWRPRMWFWRSSTRSASMGAKVT